MISLDKLFTWNRLDQQSCRKDLSLLQSSFDCVLNPNNKGSPVAIHELIGFRILRFGPTLCWLIAAFTTTLWWIFKFFSRVLPERHAAVQAWKASSRESLPTWRTILATRLLPHPPCPPPGLQSGSRTGRAARPTTRISHLTALLQPPRYPVGLQTFLTFQIMQTSLSNTFTPHLPPRVLNTSISYQPAAAAMLWKC